MATIYLVKYSFNKEFGSDILCVHAVHSSVVLCKIVKFLNQCFAQLQYPKSVCTAVTVGFVNSGHFLDIEVVQNTDLRI